MQKVNDRAVCGWLFAMSMSLLFWCWVLTGLTGCSGFKVNFGIYEVTAIAETQTLTDKRK